MSIWRYVWNKMMVNFNQGRDIIYHVTRCCFCYETRLLMQIRPDVIYKPYLPQYFVQQSGFTKLVSANELPPDMNIHTSTLLQINRLTRFFIYSKTQLYNTARKRICALKYFDEFQQKCFWAPEERSSKSCLDEDTHLNFASLALNSFASVVQLISCADCNTPEMFTRSCSGINYTVIY